MTADSGNRSVKEFIKNVLDNSNTLLITTAITVLTAALGAFAYIYQCLFLRGWNIQIDFLAVLHAEKIIYYLVFGVIYAIAVTITQVRIRSETAKLIMIMSTYWAFHRTKKAYSSLHIPDNDILPYEKLEDSQRKHFHTMKRIAIKTSISCFLALVAIFLPCWMLIQIVMGTSSVYFSISSMITVVMIATIGAMQQAIFAMPVQWSRLIQRTQELKKVSDAPGIFEKINEVMQSSIEVLELLCEEYQKKTGFIKEIIRHINIADIWTMAMSSILMGFAILLIGYFMPITQKEFWIYDSIEHGKYAVVYADGDKVFMKRVETNDGIIKIYLNEQLIATASDKTLYFEKFEKSELVHEGSREDRINNGVGSGLNSMDTPGDKLEDD